MALDPRVECGKGNTRLLGSLGLSCAGLNLQHGSGYIIFGPGEPGIYSSSTSRLLANQRWGARAVLTEPIGDRSWEH